MNMKRAPRTGLNALLHDERLRRIVQDERTLYAAEDVVELLTEREHPQELRNDLKNREAALAERAIFVELFAGDGLDLDGLLRLVQSIDSPRAERIKSWLAAAGHERMEEAENPELAILRTRRMYEQQGYSPRWIDQRMRTVSARHELTGE